MADNEVPPAPPGLAEDGKRLWSAVVDEFELGEHELQILEQAAHCSDSLTALNDALVDDPANLKLLGERRQQQITFARLLVATGIPFGVEDDDAPKQQRRAVRGVYRGGYVLQAQRS
jgi:hypothetical protein